MTDGASGESLRARAVRARVLTLSGQLDDAQALLQGVACEDLTLDVVVEMVRLAVALDDLERAGWLLDRWPDGPEPRAHLAHGAWAAVVAFQRDEADRALELIGAVVEETERDDYVGVFVDVGRPVTGPLRAHYRTSPRPFVRRVLEEPVLQAARPATDDRPSRRSIDALTEQERVVLAFLPSRLSNAAIAERLGVSLNTIKTHLKHIYQKLDVTRRSEAVEVAEKLGLL